jgi:hypothetical protein
MPHHGRPPREIREVRARREAEQLATDAGPADDPANSRWQLLQTMPLHAISATYGEAGVRERFAAGIAPMSEPDRQRLADALELESRLHRQDWRQREPYINHPLRMATRIMSHHGIRDPDVIAAALLHDTVQDHSAELAPDGWPDPEAALAELAGRFGPRVVGLVADVTNLEYDPYQDKDDSTSSTASTSRPAWTALRRQGRRPDPHHRVAADLLICDRDEQISHYPDPLEVPPAFSHV